MVAAIPAPSRAARLTIDPPRTGPTEASAQKPVQLPLTPPRALGGGPKTSSPVPTTLDSPSVHWSPKPALPVTAVFGAEMNSPEPKTSLMPSPTFGTAATLLWMVLAVSWASDFRLRPRPNPLLLLMTASRTNREAP